MNGSLLSGIIYLLQKSNKESRILSRNEKQSCDALDTVFSKKETRRLALEATKLVFENAEKAYTDGQNHKSRENMLRSAYKAGVAFSKSYV